MQGQTGGELKQLNHRVTSNYNSRKRTIKLTLSQPAHNAPAGLNYGMCLGAKAWIGWLLTGVISTPAALCKALLIKQARCVRVSACVTQYLLLAELLISIKFQ